MRLIDADRLTDRLEECVEDGDENTFITLREVLDIVNAMQEVDPGHDIGEWL